MQRRLRRGQHLRGPTRVINRQQCVRVFVRTHHVTCSRPSHPTLTYLVFMYAHLTTNTH